MPFRGLCRYSKWQNTVYPIERKRDERLVRKQREMRPEYNHNPTYIHKQYINTTHLIPPLITHTQRVKARINNGKASGLINGQEQQENIEMITELWSITIDLINKCCYTIHTMFVCVCVTIVFCYRWLLLLLLLILLWLSYLQCLVDSLSALLPGTLPCWLYYCFAHTAFIIFVSSILIHSSYVYGRKGVFPS